jgi:hypothetical protein
MGIRFAHRTVLLPPDSRAIFCSTSSCDLSPETLEVTIAETTGLGYVREFSPTPGEEYYTIIHLISGKFLSLGWSVESESLARQWIAQLVGFADWTGVCPQVRPGAVFDIFKLACIGLLLDGRSLLTLKEGSQPR